MVIDVLIVIGVGLLAGVANVCLSALLRHVPPRQVVVELTRLDKVGLTFAGVGASSLALSYLRTLWVGGERADWWQAFHLELGAAFVVLGTVEVLLVGHASSNGA